jgi:hypothetical protein
MGGKQILQAAAIFIDKSVFCCFEHLFESQDDSFWVFWYLMNVGNLIYSLEHATNFIWSFHSSICFIFVPSNVNHCRKEMGNSFVAKFFSQGRNNHRARSHLSNGQHYNIGDSPWEPPGPINSLVCILFLPCFFSTILLLHKLGASMSNF